MSYPPTYLVNIVAIHTNYQLHEIVADFLGQRTSAEAQFDESSQEGTRKKIKGHTREEFLRKSIYACCKFWILGTVYNIQLVMIYVAVKTSLPLSSLVAIFAIPDDIYILLTYVYNPF